MSAKKLILPLLFFFLALTAMAQSEKKNDLVLIEQITLKEAGVIPLQNNKGIDENLLIQDGKYNVAYISQNSFYLNPQTNSFYLKQKGKYHFANLEQYGREIAQNAIQKGKDNYIDSFILGKNISSTITQKGNHNTIKQTLTGCNMHYTLIQKGNDLSINQFEDGSALKAYKVIQKGNDMSITIINGNIY